MKVHFISGYYSDLASRKIRRPEDYWDAYFYVWAVKMGQFKRKFYIHSKKEKIEVQKSNFSVAREMFGRFTTKRVEADWGKDVQLVPVPSKDAVGDSSDFRTSRMLCESLSKTGFSDQQIDALSWSEELQQAHQGGSRRRDFLKQHLELRGEVKGCKLILVDDLLSTGASLLASKEFLEENGATVLGAVTCGRTIYDFKTPPFGRQTMDLVEELADFGK